MYILLYIFLFLLCVDSSANPDILTPLRKTLLFGDVKEETIAAMPSGVKEVNDYQLSLIVGEGIRLVHKNISFEEHIKNTFIQDKGITKEKAIHRFCQFWTERLIRHLMQKREEANYLEEFKKEFQEAYKQNLVSSSYLPFLSSLPDLSRVKPRIYHQLTGIKGKIKNFEKNIKASQKTRQGMTIPFYEKNKAFYEFTNFYKASTGGYKTSEAFFQGQKFPTNPALQQQIRQAQTPREVFDIAQNNKNAVITGWSDQRDAENPNGKNIQAMRKALQAKFKDNPYLRALLLAVYGCTLIEDAGKNDGFWGNGAQGTGYNWLGRVLMEMSTYLMVNQIIPPSSPGADVTLLTQQALQSSGLLSTYQHFLVKLGLPLTQGSPSGTMSSSLIAQQLNQLYHGHFQVEETTRGLAVTAPNTQAAQSLCQDVGQGCSLDPQDSKRVLVGRTNGIPNLLKFVGKRAPLLPNLQNDPVSFVKQVLGPSFMVEKTTRGLAVTAPDAQAAQSLCTRVGKGCDIDSSNNRKVRFGKRNGIPALINYLHSTMPNNVPASSTSSSVTVDDIASTFDSSFRVEKTSRGLAIMAPHAQAAQSLCAGVGQGCSIDPKDSRRVLFGKTNGIPHLLRYLKLTGTFIG